MESITHRNVRVNGINMHVAEKGEGPVVLMLHGFPDLWYSWRHQIVALSAQGYRAVAPDLRGYGDTDAPTDVSSYTCFHLAGDIVALIDSLGVDKVFLVGHDWGALVGWYVCLFAPKRIKAYVCLEVPFEPYIGRHNPNTKLVDVFRSLYGDDFYVCRFQKPGEIEAQMAEAGGAAFVCPNMLTTRKPGLPVFPKGEYGYAFNYPDMPKTLPHWLSEKDVDLYVTKFNETGFTGALNYYRNLSSNWELLAPWTGVGVDNVPVKFIIGDKGLVYTTPEIQKYIHDGSFKKHVPSLEEVVILQDVAHFCHQEAAEDVTNHIYKFIQKF